MPQPPPIPQVGMSESGGMRGTPGGMRGAPGGCAGHRGDARDDSTWGQGVKGVSSFPKSRLLLRFKRHIMSNPS